MTLHDFCRENGREELLTQWDDAKNRPLTPDDVTPGSHRFVWWRCENGHAWRSAVSTRAGKQRCGCPYCSGRTVLVGFNDLQTLYPALIAEWDGEKNGALAPETLHPYSNRRVWWRCSLGHSYAAVVADRARKKCGCPYCAGRKVLVGFNDLASKEPVLALQWHPTRNGSLTPQQLTPGSSRKVWWQCENGHAWRSAVSTRAGKQRCGCPVCAGRPMDRCTAVISEAPAEPEKISAQTAGSRGVNI